jgi:nucleoid DNA-binding protein
MEGFPKQVAGYLDLLIGTATAQTRKLGDLTIPSLGKLVKAKRAARMGRNPARLDDQDQGEDNGEVPGCEGRHGST